MEPGARTTSGKRKYSHHQARKLRMRVSKKKARSRKRSQRMEKAKRSPESNRRKIEKSRSVTKKRTGTIGHSNPKKKTQSTRKRAKNQGKTSQRRSRRINLVSKDIRAPAATSSQNQMQTRKWLTMQSPTCHQRRTGLQKAKVQKAPNRQTLKLIKRRTPHNQDRKESMRGNST